MKRPAPDIIAAVLDRMSASRKKAFADLPHLLDPALLDANARVVARRMRSWEKSLSYVYNYTRHGGMGRDQWNDHAVASIAASQIQMYFLVHSHDYFKAMEDDPRLLAAIDDLNAPGGTLVLACHNGFRQLFVDFFSRFARDGLIVRAKAGKGGNDPRNVSAASDPRGALFTALRRLTDGGQVYVAPDGPHATRTRDIFVLGHRVPVGEGAAFLAGQSRARVRWLSIRREGQTFIPVLREGPQRDDGERTSDYEARFWDFYAGCIAEHLQGPPWDTAIGGNWIQLLRNDVVSELPRYQAPSSSMKADL